MLSLPQLLYKLKLQSKSLAKSLNLPENLGYDLLATSIYQHLDFEDLCDSITELDYSLNISSLSEHQKLKYLLICEVEDLIIDLHKEIENMAIRLESKTVINISKLQLISNLYKLFGLDNESKYTVNAENVNLDWQPYFDSLQNKQSVVFSDLIINEISFRLIATKIEFDEVSLNYLNESFKKNIVQISGPSFQNHKEKLQIDKHRKWLVDTSQCLINLETDNLDEMSYYYEIKNENYLVYGFPLSPRLSIYDKDKCCNLNIQIKDTKEKQIFILNIESQKLVIECIFIKKVNDGDNSFSSKEQWIKDTLLSREDSCGFPVIFNYACYFLLIRPFSEVDYLENAL